MDLGKALRLQELGDPGLCPASPAEIDRRRAHRALVGVAGFLSDHVGPAPAGLSRLAHRLGIPGLEHAVLDAALVAALQGVLVAPPAVFAVGLYRVADRGVE